MNYYFLYFYGLMTFLAVLYISNNWSVFGTLITESHGCEAAHSWSPFGITHQASIGQRKGALYRHMMEKHVGNRPNFQMNVTGIYGNDAMLRQIPEAVAIQNSDPEFLMNNKSEWNHQVVPQVVIRRTWWASHLLELGNLEMIIK